MTYEKKVAAHDDGFPDQPLFGSPRYIKEDIENCAVQESTLAKPFNQSPA